MTGDLFAVRRTLAAAADRRPSCSESTAPRCGLCGEAHPITTCHRFVAFEAGVEAMPALDDVAHVPAAEVRRA